MATTPLMPLGSTLKRQNPSTLAYEEIPQIKSMGFPGSTQEYDDITNLGSPAGFRERVATVKAPRDLPVEIVFNPAEAMHNALIDDSMANPVPKRKFRQFFPDGVKGFEFEAFVGSPDGSLTPVAASVITFQLGTAGLITRLS